MSAAVNLPPTIGGVEWAMSWSRRSGKAKILRLTADSHRSVNEIAAELDWVFHLFDQGDRKSVV